jgi:hypothetical protein
MPFVLMKKPYHSLKMALFEGYFQAVSPSWRLWAFIKATHFDIEINMINMKLSLTTNGIRRTIGCTKG